MVFSLVMELGQAALKLLAETQKTEDKPESADGESESENGAEEKKE